MTKEEDIDSIIYFLSKLGNFKFDRQTKVYSFFSINQLLFEYTRYFGGILSIHPTIIKDFTRSHTCNMVFFEKLLLRAIYDKFNITILHIDILVIT